VGSIEAFPGSLDTRRRVPQIISDRVRTLGGDLVIDSRQGLGTRLEISVPG
jgi:hypothetical protein